MRISTIGRSGRFTRSAGVYSNDPKNPETRISISMVVKQYISVKPSNQIRLIGYEGDKIKKQVTITSIEEQPLKIGEITSDIKDKIKYKLKTIKKGKDYTLEVKNRSTQEGSFRGKIELKTNSEKKPLVVVYVTGRLPGNIEVIPKSVSFGTIDTTKEIFDSMNFMKTVSLRDVRGDGLTIKKIKTSKNWIMTETKSKKEGQYNITITLDKDRLPKGDFKEKIDIRTNKRRKSIAVDVKGEVI